MKVNFSLDNPGPFDNIEIPRVNKKGSAMKTTSFAPIVVEIGRVRIGKPDC